MIKNFNRKTYGAIYVDKEKNIERVKEIIKIIDEFEYDYLPSDLIKPMSEFGKVGYTSKFTDIDLIVLQKICYNEGIMIISIECGNKWGFDANDYKIDKFII